MKVLSTFLSGFRWDCETNHTGCRSRVRLGQTDTRVEERQLHETRSKGHRHKAAKAQGGKAQQERDTRKRRSMIAELTISTVAVGTDGSKRANRAVAAAAEIARRFDAKLVLLSAFENSPHSGDEDVELQWASNSSAVVRSLLERIEAELREDGLKCEARADQGDPVDVLVKLAAECEADLLVIGNKGMERRILGSVPNGITHKADCSVLVVKTA
jgi:nucleotide-binding universal stress UspA family protein